MFLAISRFAVANDKSGDVRDAFRQRPQPVGSDEGFVRTEVAHTADKDRMLQLEVIAQ